MSRYFLSVSRQILVSIDENGDTSLFQKWGSIDSYVKYELRTPRYIQFEHNELNGPALEFVSGDGQYKIVVNTENHRNNYVARRHIDGSYHSMAMNEIAETSIKREGEGNFIKIAAV